MVFQFHNEVHSSFAQWCDVMRHKSSDYINGIRLVQNEGILVLQTGSLTELREGAEYLINQRDVSLINKKAN